MALDPLTLILNIRQGNIAAPAIIIFTVNLGGVIIAEASLSFLGFGLPPDVPSWEGCSAAKDGNTWRWRRGWRCGQACA